MSVEASHVQSAGSPAFSGRSSPVKPKRRVDHDGQNIKADKATRRYAAGVDRALSLFDSALQEWADYISFLARLLKALQLHPPGISDVPHKSVVARRLSQCLNPTLPAGVHQKALEVYTYIFSLIGKAGLGRDLPYYLPGLSPVLAFASLSVKPHLLSLFDTFIVALDPVALRPALKAILLALLPGLEEESSDEFEQTLVILQRLKEAVAHGEHDGRSLQDASGHHFFWQSLFLAAITSPSRRQGALAYLQRHLPRLGKSAESRHRPNGQDGERTREFSGEVEAITSPEPGLLIRCFIAGLGDENVLTQRGFLDMLVTHLPLRSEALHRKVSPRDLIKLTSAAVSVVLRREMSLNRRLWTWFLGSKDQSADEASGPASPDDAQGHIETHGRRTEYFRQYGHTLLVEGLLQMFESDLATVAEKARPFRVALALMDRWEIGSLVIPHIFLPALKSIWSYQRVARTPEDFTEVLRSGKGFFDGVESGLIWDEISIKLLCATSMQSPDQEPFRESLDLIAFVIAHFELQEEEMLVRHIPFLALALLLKGTQHQEKERERTVAKRVLVLTGQLIDLIPGRALDIRTTEEPTRDIDYSALEAENHDFLVKMEEHYIERRGKTQSAATAIDSDTLGRLYLANILQAVRQQLRLNRLGPLFYPTISILDKICRKLPQSHLHDVTGLLSDAVEASGHITGVRLEDVTHFVSLLETIRVVLPSIQNDSRLRLILPNMVTALWPYLSPGRPKSNIEAVRCVWKVHSLSADKSLVESCVTSLMLRGLNRSDVSLDIEGARRFGILWSNSNAANASKRGAKVDRPRDEQILGRPLLLLLDSLEDTRTDLFVFTSGWLQSSMNVEVIVSFLLTKLQTSLFQPTVNTDDPKVDVDACLYYLRTTLNVVEYTPLVTWSTLLMKVHGPKHDTESAPTTTQVWLTMLCLTILSEDFGARHNDSRILSRTQQTAASLLQEAVLRSTSLADIEAKLESSVLTTLSRSVRIADHSLQLAVMRLMSVWLERRSGDMTRNQSAGHGRVLSGDAGSQAHLSQERLGKQEPLSGSANPPPLLFDCLLQGLAAAGSQPVLSHWIRFLEICLPFYTSSTFHTLMPLNDRFVGTIEALFKDVQESFKRPDNQSTATDEPINTIIELFNGLEHVLAQAHDRLSESEASHASIKVPEQPQGFFNKLGSGVFPLDAHRSRSTTTNNRLTVLLCFKDAVKLCVRFWSWGAEGSESTVRDPALSASFNHTSLRLKNRARRLLEHMFAAESLECLETLIDSWRGSQQAPSTGVPSTTILSLLHVLDGSRPRNTIPAIFNALYSRTNPGALDPDRKSTLSSELSDIEIARFLVHYTQSLEDDAMDEIWNDCMTFLKDVQANPLPHRQTLTRLLEFIALLGVKVDNTNFGENRKRRRELADLFLRQLTAAFTAKPLSFPSESTSSSNQKPSDEPSHPPRTDSESTGDDIVAVLAAIMPNVSKILIDSDRITTAANTVSTQVVMPTLRWKSFPQNVTSIFLDLLLYLTRIAEASKVWRKDLAEAFNDPKFFCGHSYKLASSHWLPLLRQWIIADKDRVDELLSRMPSPTAAGIMFGVGASSARLEADRKTQLNLRRVTTLVLAAPKDSFVMQLGAVQEKIADLFNATAASSPSSATRADIYSLLRALILKTSPVHLASIWPSVTTELYDAISSIYPGRNQDKYNMHCVVHACKLLDILVVAAPEDFQMREWLFVTDTIDAVYRPQDFEPSALVDDLIEDLDTSAGSSQNATNTSPTPQAGSRKPLLTSKNLQGVPREKLLDRAIRPFLRQLSINTFESTYSMAAFDWQAAFDDLLFDIFNDTNLV